MGEGLEVEGLEEGLEEGRRCEWENCLSARVVAGRKNGRRKIQLDTDRVLETCFGRQYF